MIGQEPRERPPRMPRRGREMTDTTGWGRQRRASTEVHNALLSAAAHLFARDGFARTTTRDIAAEAGTAETAIFRHFGSKAELFAEAVVAPFTQLVSTFAERWWPEIPRPSDNETLLRRFLEDLYDAMDQQREPVLALLSAQGDPEAADAVHEAQRRLNRFYAELRAMAAARAEHAPGFSPLFVHELTTRFVVGMVVLVTAFEPWFIPQGLDRPSKAETLDTMARFVLGGLIDRPGASGAE